MDHDLAVRLKQALDAHDPKSLNEVRKQFVRGRHEQTFVVFAYGWPTLLTAVLKSPSLFAGLNFHGPEISCDTEDLRPGTQPGLKVDPRRGGRLMAF